MEFVAFEKWMIDSVRESKNDVLVSSYLQSYKYFMNNFSDGDAAEIAKLFQFREPAHEKACRIREQIRKKWIDFGLRPVLIGVHIRRSSFVLLPSITVPHFSHVFQASLQFMNQIQSLFSKAGLAQGSDQAGQA